MCPLSGLVKPRTLHTQPSATLCVSPLDSVLIMGSREHLSLDRRRRLTREEVALSAKTELGRGITPRNSQSHRTRLPASRKADVLEYTAMAGRATVAELVTQFEVSADTIRRDLDQLDAEGLIVRTHGGAMAKPLVPRPDTGLDVRMELNSQAKDAIGRLAAKLIPDEATVLVNAGTTTLALARHLRKHKRLRIVTNSLRLPTELDPDAVQDVYLLGGEVYLRSQSTVGPVAMQTRENGETLNFHCDVGVFAVAAVSPIGGFSVGTFAEAEMIRDMMHHSSKVIVLADSSKLNQRMLAQICDFSMIDHFVTDKTPGTTIMHAMENAGVSIEFPEKKSEPRITTVH